MAKYRIQGPDGATYEVTAPDDATQEQVLAYVQAQHQPAKPKADFSNVPSSSAKPTTVPKAKPPATYNLTGVPGVSTQLGGFLDAVQHHAMNIPHGAAQLVEHGVNAAANALLPAPEQTVGGLVSGQRPEAHGLARVRQYINDTVAADDAALRQREADYQARTAGNFGSYPGAVLGEVAPWMVGIGEARAAGLLPQISKGEGIIGKLAEYGKKGLALAGEGGLMGLVQPVTGDGSYGGQKAAQVVTGAVAAPALGVASKAAGAASGAVQSGYRYLTPAGQEKLAASRLGAMLEQAGADPAALRVPSKVPGYVPSAAEANPSGAMVSMERGLRNDKNGAGIAFADQEAANNAVLRSQVERLAGTDAQLSAAEKALRDGPGRFWSDNLTAGDAEGRFARAGQHLRQAANSKPLPMPEFKVLDEARRIVEQVHRGTKDALTGENEINALAPKSAFGKRALDQAKGILNQGMVDPSRVIGGLQKLALSGNPTVSGAAEKQLAVIAKNQVDSTGWVHAGVLDDLRQNIGNVITDQFGKVDKVAAAKFAPVQGQMVRTVERAVPGYRDSLAAYRAGKQPINDMEAARQLLGSIDSGGRDVAGNQAVRLSDLKAALSRDSRRKYPMSDNARNQLSAIMDTLQQRTVPQNKIAAAGSNTRADMEDALQGSLSKLILRHVPGAELVVAGGKLVNRGVNRRVGELASNASRAADALEAARRRQSTNKLAQLLLPYQP